MRRHACTLAIGVVLAMPLLVGAQSLSELQQQVNALVSQITLLQSQLKTIQAKPGISSTSCPNLSRTLGRGAQGTDVSELQRFLAKDSSVYPSGQVTGYFGSLTEKAVQAWQSKNGVVNSGSPSSTGWGVVGARTRAAIAATCATPLPPSAPTSAQNTFVATPRSGLSPLFVSFVAMGLDSGVKFTLDFGDGTSTPLSNATTTNISHTYSAPGAYRATLTRVEPRCPLCADSAFIMIGTANISVSGQVPVASTTAIFPGRVVLREGERATTLDRVDEILLRRISLYQQSATATPLYLSATAEIRHVPCAMSGYIVCTQVPTSAERYFVPGEKIVLNGYGFTLEALSSTSSVFFIAPHAPIAGLSIVASGFVGTTTPRVVTFTIGGLDVGTLNAITFGDGSSTIVSATTTITQIMHAYANTGKYSASVQNSYGLAQDFVFTIE